MSYFKKICILLLSSFLTTILYAQHDVGKTMFRNQITIQRSIRLKNLADVNFSEKSDIEKSLEELTASAKDPYAASIALIASAEIGDEKQYQVILSKMITLLENLNKTTESNIAWMQNNSFKAWMWGRVLLAADSMDDTNTVIEAQKKLHGLLEKDFSSNDNLAFFAWAWGYRAGLNEQEYTISKAKMLDTAMRLTAKSKGSGNHEMLSDALWAWVMNLQAAAYAGDKKSYDWIKRQITSLTDEKSVTQALEKGLLRTTESNDYPAWAMAKARYAAIVIDDKDLYQEIKDPLKDSIKEALKANAKAEYILSNLENELAILIALHLQTENKTSSLLQLKK